MLVPITSRFANEIESRTRWRVPGLPPPNILQRFYLTQLYRCTLFHELYFGVSALTAGQTGPGNFGWGESNGDRDSKAEAGQFRPLIPPPLPPLARQLLRQAALKAKGGSMRMFLTNQQTLVLLALFALFSVAPLPASAQGYSVGETNWQWKDFTTSYTARADTGSPTDRISMRADANSSLLRWIQTVSNNVISCSGGSVTLNLSYSWPGIECTTG